MIDRKEHKDLAEDTPVRNHTQELVGVLVLVVLVDRSLRLLRERRRLERHRTTVTATTAATPGQPRVRICAKFNWHSHSRQYLQ